MARLGAFGVGVEYGIWDTGVGWAWNTESLEA